MKIEITLNLTSEELYNFLCDNFKNEMKIKGDLKEGSKYKKILSTRFSPEVNTTVEVFKLVKNKEYSLKFYTPVGENLVSYEIEDIKENKIKLTYIEKYKTNSFFRKLNNDLMELIFYFPMKAKKKKILAQIEQYLIGERTKNV